jgi:hypothetical protein
MEDTMILSASRRTDLPGYYSEWFLNRLRDGYALYRNPMNHAQICRVELSPENIDCIVFWTKDPYQMMDKLEQLEQLGYHYYFQFTLTPYGNEIEPKLRDKQDILATFQQLSRRLGKNRVLWRYDPIILNDDFTMEYHRQQFAYLCKELSGYTDICTISFVDQYAKLNRSVKEQVVKEITTQQMHLLATDLVRIAKQYHIELRACCETIDLSSAGVIPASCIDKLLIEQVCGHPITAKKDKSQRSGCGCIRSVDLGAYNTCMHGCIYCYANHSETSILRNCAKHDPNSPMLIGNIDAE